MRILHVVPTYLPAWRHGGPIRSVHGLCRALVELGHEVHVATTDVDVPADVPRGREVDVDGVLVRYFPVAAPRRLYRSPALGRALAEEAATFDVLHLHSVFLHPVDAAGAAARRAGVPYVVAPRGMLVPELFRQRGYLRKRLWLALAGRRLLAGAAALHATSELEAADAAALGIPVQRVCVIPNGVDLPAAGAAAEELPPPVRAFGGAPYVLFLGRLSWKKGLERTIEGFAAAPGAARLVIAGHDDEGIGGALGALAARHGVADRVVFVGPVAGAARDALLEHAAGLVLCSFSENFANVVVEAMAAATPVVVTPEVGLAATVAEVGCGLVTPGEPAAIGRAIGGLLADPTRAKAMGERGARAARERFAWRAVALQAGELYASLRGGAPGVAAPRSEPAEVVAQ